MLPLFQPPTLWRARGCGPWIRSNRSSGRRRPRHPRDECATESPELHEVVAELLRGLRQSEIAADHNLNAVTVRTRVRRARERLGPGLRKHLVSEPALARSVYRCDRLVASPGPWRRITRRGCGEEGPSIDLRGQAEPKPSMPRSGPPAMVGPDLLSTPPIRQGQSRFVAARTLVPKPE